MQSRRACERWGGPKAVPVALAALALLAAVGCGAAGAMPPHKVALSKGGRVGPLRIGHSSRSQVIAFAGKPSSEHRGSYAPGLPRVDALFYGCRVARGKFDVGEVTSCRTIYWVDARSGKLVDFWTRDPRYVASGGVRVGVTTAVAERATRKKAVAGCGGASIRSTNGGTLFVVQLSGTHQGKASKSGYPPVLGGRVSLIVLHDTHVNAGVIDCVDR